MLKFTSDITERLDKYLAHAAKKSRGTIQKAIKAGAVTVNGEKVLETDIKIKPGDVVEAPEFKDFEFAPSEREIKIVYEDDDILVIDKPAGLLVHPGAGKTEDTLSHALITKYPQIKSVGESFRPGIVHRLDEDTSGLMLVAKTPAAYEYLKGLFLDRKVEKKYLTLVHGIPEKLHDIIDLPLAKNFKRRKMKVGEGKPAVTEYSVAAQTPEGVDRMALLRVNLHTGRTHQIRAHLSAIGHPVVGDQTYGGTYKDADSHLINRQFLHAYHLRFQKMDGTVIDLESTLPEELLNFLNQVKIKYD